MKIEVRLNKHPLRKNNFLVAGMYQLYLSGKSLQEVGRVYKKTRQAVYDVFRTRGYPLRTKQLKGQQILDGISFTITKGGYLRGSFNGRRLLMHQYVWEKHTGKKLERGWVIIHKDANKENNAFENLEAMTLSEWNKKFSPHLNQFTSPTGSRKKSYENLRNVWTNQLKKQQ
jgi:hypothetical protein